MNKYAVAGLISLTLTASAQVSAAQDPAGKTTGPTTPWYAGIGLGKSISSGIPNETIGNINSTISVPSGATFTLIDQDKRSTGAKLVAGYTFGPNFAVEGGYVSLGKTTVNMDFRAGLVSVNTLQAEYKMSAVFVDALGMLPLNDKWSLLGRVGVSYSRVSANVKGSPLTLAISNNDKSESKIHEKFGAGVDYNLTPVFTVRAEWERYKMSDPLGDGTLHVDAALLSVLYHF